MKRYPNEVQEFIRDNVTGTRIKKLIEIVNEKFDTAFTDTKMKSYLKNNGLKNGLPGGNDAGNPSKRYPAEVREFITANYKGTGPYTMAELLNKTFGTDYTKSQLNSYYGNHHLDSGLTGRYKKGHESFNKGKTGCCAPGCEKGWFKKGHVPTDHRPVGSERIDNKDGYTWIKTAEPNRWRPKHKVLWEQHNGKAPRGSVVTFLDGDKGNISIENLALISLSENALLNNLNLRSTDPDITKAGILISKIKLIKYKRKKELKQ